MLRLFDISFEGRSILVRWTTEVEIDNAGFNVYRGGSAGGERSLLNEHMIPALGGGLKGASYCLRDDGVTENGTYYYWLEDIDLNDRAAVHGPIVAEVDWFGGEPGAAPALSVGLAQNSPNPFKAFTVIEFGVSGHAWVRLAIYDAAGHLVRTVSAGYRETGYYRECWDGRDADGRTVPAGLYFYSLTVNGSTETRKMVFVQ
jgi:hypothetical protein